MSVAKRLARKLSKVQKANGSMERDTSKSDLGTKSSDSANPDQPTQTADDESK